MVSGSESLSRSQIKMVSIQKPQLKDLDEIRNILAQWNDETDTEKYFSRVKNEIEGINEFNMKFWIAFDEEALGIIGLCDLSPDLISFSKTDKPGQLKILYLDDKERGKGTGKKLVEFIEKEAKRQGYKEFFVKSAEIYKKTGWGFYKKMGYRPIGLIDNKIHNGRSQIFLKVLE